MRCIHIEHWTTTENGHKKSSTRMSFRKRFLNWSIDHLGYRSYQHILYTYYCQSLVRCTLRINQNTTVSSITLVLHVFLARVPESQRGSVALICRTKLATDIVKCSLYSSNKSASNPCSLYSSNKSKYHSIECTLRSYLDLNVALSR